MATEAQLGIWEGVMSASRYYVKIYTNQHQLALALEAFNAD